MARPPWPWQGDTGPQGGEAAMTVSKALGAMPCCCGGSVLLGSLSSVCRKRVLRVWIRKGLNAWSPQPDLCSDHCWFPRPCHLCGSPAGERACIPQWRRPARAFISEDRMVLVPRLWQEVNQRVRFHRHPFLSPCGSAGLYLSLWWCTHFCRDIYREIAGALCFPSYGRTSQDRCSDILALMHGTL